MKITILTLLLIPTLTFASITSNLKFGMANSQVLELQTFLVSKGYLQETAKTGYFGYKTLGAVKNYQSELELPSTGFVGPLTRKSIENSKTVTTTKVIEATTTIDILATSTKEMATTTEVKETILTNVEKPIAPVIVKSYNNVMEETAPTYTIGTPVTINKVSGDGEAYSYVELPITFDRSIMNVGNKVTIEGTIVNDTNTQSAGNEFSFAPTSPTNQFMNLGNVHGTFGFTLTLTDNRGTVLYTNNDSVVIN